MAKRDVIVPARAGLRAFYWRADGGVTVFAIDPGLVRTAMSEPALSGGEPGIKQWFIDAFANQQDVSTASAATSVVYLASGAADVLSRRSILATGDVRRGPPGRPRLKSTICTYCVNANSSSRIHQHRCLGHRQDERACGPAFARGQALQFLTRHRVSALCMTEHRRPRRSSRSAPDAGHAMKRRSAYRSAVHVHYGVTACHRRIRRAGRLRGLSAWRL
jgi:hypothetical protein